MYTSRHRYAVNLDVTPEVWDNEYDSVNRQAESLLKRAVADDGRYPVGPQKVVHVQGLMPPRAYVLRSGDVWIPGAYDEEWRDEEFCDPELVYMWRVTFVMEALDPLWNEADMK